MEKLWMPILTDSNKHFSIKREYRSKTGTLRSQLICGLCGAIWPCYGKQKEVIENAIAKRKIAESDLAEHQN